MFKILFVDDEAVYKLTIHNLVDWSSIGFELAGTASNGAEALEFLRCNQVHGIITDLEMPVMDGVSLIQTLRREGFTGPILALSNFSDYNHVRGALTAGAFDYLVKIDMSAAQLTAALEKMKNYITNQEMQPSPSVKDHTQQMNRHLEILHAYLQTPMQEEIPTTLTDAFSPQFFPARLCTIKVFKTFPNQNSLSDFFRNVVSECLKELDGLPILPFQNNELVFLIPQKSLDSSGINLSARLIVLVRQVITFLSVEPLVTVSAIINDFFDIKQQYKRCSVSYARSFYSDHTAILFLPPASDDDQILMVRDSFISASITSLKSTNRVEFQVLVNNYIKACAQKMVSSSLLKDSLTVLAWCCRDLGILTVTPSQFQEITAQIETSPNSNHLAQSVVEIFSQYTNSGRNSSSPVRPEIAKIILYVNQNCSNKITLENVANHVGLAREYLSRLFLRETGINLFQYIMEVRMRKAAELLNANSNMLIKEVALAVGFDNQYSFSKKFKEHFGVSPNMYKENLLTQTNPKKESVQ